MEVSYELLWKICSGFLLSLLVYGLVSLILYCSNSSIDDEKTVKSSISGGKKKKRVKFLDQVDVIRSVDDGFIKDIGVDDVNRLVGVDKIGEKDDILMGESGGGCRLGLVDLFEKGKILVGFDGGVDVGVGECLGNDVVIDKREKNSSNSSMEIASGENKVEKIVGSDIQVNLCSDELADDHREQNSMNWNNVYEEKEVLDVNRVEKIAVCDVDVSLCSKELVDDHTERNSSKVYEEEVDEGDRVDKLDNSELVDDKRDIKDDKIMDDQRGEEAKVENNVGSKGTSGGVLNKEGVLNDEEEWEGIERSDLAKEFARAKCFVENDDKEIRLAMAGSNDLMMQLYGLEKVAMEGPCHEPQPMALKFAARAKWNAWQKLGNMSPEEAMEQYISVLSQNVPNWMEYHSSVSCVIRTSKVSDLADV